MHSSSVLCHVFSRLHMCFLPTIINLPPPPPPPPLLPRCGIPRILDVSSYALACMGFACCGTMISVYALPTSTLPPLNDSIKCRR